MQMLISILKIRYGKTEKQAKALIKKYPEIVNGFPMDYPEKAALLASK